MDMSTLFSAALHIEKPWFVKNVDFDVKQKRLNIMLDFVKGSTFGISGIDGEYKAYDTLEKSWRHLNFFEHECYLTARVPRVKTPDGKIHLIEPGWSGFLNGFTLLFEALILQLATSMPVHQLSKVIKISDYKIWEMLDKYVANAREHEAFAAINTIGMDETSIAKGHDYITLFVDLEQKRTIFVTDGKGSKTVEDFTKDLKAHGGDANHITDVSCDMSPAFIKGVRDNLPNAEITFDKFHILKIINEAVDKVRRAEAVNNPLLKGTRYIFLKNEANLTTKQKQKKVELSMSKQNAKSLRALNIRETFQQIYNAEDMDLFTSRLKGWYYWATHSKLEPIKQVAYTIKRHWDGVIRWKISQINNGILEGLNSIIQAAKRKARGYKLKHFKTIAYLITGKLDFSKVNKACLPT
jgi:transposase